MRSSNIIKSPEVWEIIIAEMMLKTDPDKRERVPLEINISIETHFKLTPFEIFKFFVETQHV